MKHLVLISAAVLSLAACGSSDKDRAVSGGGIGAGVGAATGLLIGGPLGGFVLGGAVGAATGLVTDEATIDLGEPVWNRSQAEASGGDQRQASGAPPTQLGRDGEIITRELPPKDDDQTGSSDGTQPSDGTIY